MKCYVTDNNKRLTVDAFTKMDAAMKFIDFFKGRGILLGKYIAVSEQGFNEVLDTNSIFDTDEIMSVM